MVSLFKQISVCGTFLNCSYRTLTNHHNFPKVCNPHQTLGLFHFTNSWDICENNKKKLGPINLSSSSCPFQSNQFGKLSYRLTWKQYSIMFHIKTNQSKKDEKFRKYFSPTLQISLPLFKNDLFCKLTKRLMSKQLWHKAAILIP